MNTQKLSDTAKYLVRTGRGLLAADESANTCAKRFEAVGVENSEENRRKYRETLIEAKGNENQLSGIIYFDETFWQKNDQGVLFRESADKRGILAGIKVDEGLVDLAGFPNEKVSKGLDTLPERMKKYQEAGARFAKWRSVITIGEGIPTKECIDANAFVLARYARICQDHEIVPIVEPEVLFDGTHTPIKAEEVMGHTFEVLFRMMQAFRVHMSGAILKTSMVLPGKDSGIPVDAEDVSIKTARVLHEKVPHDLGGVVFLSGGQTPTDAMRNLNAIAQKGPHPWGVTFSYSRALQDPVLKYWAAHRDDTEGSSAVFTKQLAFAALARDGKLPAEISADTFVTKSQDL
jgi:fructose-bisphosphate aldolase, class I